MARLLGLCLCLCMFAACGDDDTPGEDGSLPGANNTGNGGADGSVSESPEDNLPEEARAFVGLWCDRSKSHTMLMLNADGTMFHSLYDNSYYPKNEVKKGYWTYDVDTRVLSMTTTGNQVQVTLSNPTNWVGIGLVGDDANYERPKNKADSTNVMFSFYCYLADKWICQEDADKSFVCAARPGSSIPWYPNGVGRYRIGSEQMAINAAESSIPSTYTPYGEYRAYNWDAGYVILEWRGVMCSYRTEYTIQGETKVGWAAHSWSYEGEYENENNMQDFTLKITGEALEGTYKPQYEPWVYE